MRFTLIKLIIAIAACVYICIYYYFNNSLLKSLGGLLIGISLSISLIKKIKKSNDGI